MNKSKKLRQIALITGIPGIIVFFITVLLLKFVEASKISSFVAIIILLIVCGGVVLGIIKLLSTLMNCFTDVSNNIDEIAEGKATIDFHYKAKNDATKELLEHVQSLIFRIC